MNLNTITENRIIYYNFLKDKQENNNNFLEKVDAGKICLALKGGDRLVRIEKSSSLIGRIFEAICRFFTGVQLDPKKVEVFTAKMLFAFESDKRIELIVGNSLKYKTDIELINQKLADTQKLLEDALIKLVDTQKCYDNANLLISSLQLQMEILKCTAEKESRKNLKRANVYQEQNESIREAIETYNNTHSLKIGLEIPEITEDDFELFSLSEEESDLSSSEESISESRSTEENVKDIDVGQKNQTIIVQ